MVSASDREPAHRTSENLAHLKDEVDEKNTEHIEHARQAEPGGSGPAPERDADEQPPDPRED
ncbi:hypothetical protein ACFC1T_18090 [Kitasatospora sp. NPDC056076]|uniref:hypothetical protein n=1 Tax=Kitasatospora sp. NPDC056076 TaxID=3345703 RepID=UPI0035D61BBB